MCVERMHARQLALTSAHLLEMGASLICAIIATETALDAA